MGKVLTTTCEPLHICLARKEQIDVLLKQDEWGSLGIHLEWLGLEQAPPPYLLITGETIKE